MVAKQSKAGHRLSFSISSSCDESILDAKQITLNVQQYSASARPVLPINKKEEEDEDENPLTEGDLCVGVASVRKAFASLVPFFSRQHSEHTCALLIKENFGLSFF